jgi:hypoxanthine phosphoribosyltransferase|tara:strand:- start:41 stop:466 length:426 start_codon:yes stop_codon:yes gene_type:complete
MKKLYLSYHDIHTDSIKLAKKIKRKYKPTKIAIASRGGLIPGTIIANYLNIQDINLLELTENPEIDNFRKNKIENTITTNEKIIVIDDLISGGNTSNIIKKKMPKSKMAVLYTKTTSKKKADLYLYNFNKDHWIVFPWEQE